MPPPDADLADAAERAPVARPPRAVDAGVLPALKNGVEMGGEPSVGDTDDDSETSPSPPRAMVDATPECAPMDVSSPCSAAKPVNDARGGASGSCRRR